MHKKILFTIAVFICIAPQLTQAESGAFDQSTYVSAPNATFDVTIQANDLVNAGGVDFVLEYDPSIVSYATTTEGLLMAPIMPPVLDATTSVAGGREQLVISILSMMPVNGSGDLATVTFETNSAGGSDSISMEEMTMYDYDTPASSATATTPGNVSVYIPSGTAAQTTYADLSPNATFDVTIQANDLVNAGGVDFVLEYDPSIVSYATTTEGLLMAPIMPPVLDATTSVAGGREQLVISILSMMPVNGSGDLATVTFETNSAGGSDSISMEEMTMYDYDTPAQSVVMATNTDISVSITPPDTTPPVRSALGPSGALAQGTEQTTLTVTTDESATCRYSEIENTLFADGTLFSTTGSTTHTTAVSVLSGWSYTFYVRCEDALNNANTTDATISFSVDAAVSSGGGGGGGGGGSSRDDDAPRSTSVEINDGDSLTTSRTVTLALTARDSSEPIDMQISNSEDFEDATWVDFVEKYTWVLPAVNGEHTVYARFKDNEDNTSDPVSDTIKLQASAAELTKTIATPKPVQTANTFTQTVRSSYTFGVNMGIGSQSPAVVELQKRLRAEGHFTFPTNTGYYGSVTAEAVRKYQVAHGISGTGYVGPLTRAELNKGGSSGGTLQQQDDGEISLATFVRLLIALEIIPKEKADIALAALNLI